jgi:adenosine deaminase
VHLNRLANTALLKSLIQASINELPYDFDLSHDLTRHTPANSLFEYLKPWQALRLEPKSREDLSKIVNSAFSELRRATEPARLQRRPKAKTNPNK